MRFRELDFVPIVLGGDINTYSIARAFYEAYGIQSYVFGKYPTGPSYGSKIAVYEAVPDIESEEGLLRTVRRCIERHPHKKIILFGCSDGYVSLIKRCIHQLPPLCVAPYPEYGLMEELQRKDFFYELCEKNNISYPDTLIYTQDMGLNFEMSFPYPVILKASESTSYWEHEFEGQKKVYLLDNRQELEETIEKIYSAGYENPLIIQDTIPGNDEFMYVVTSYSNQDGKVEMMCLGHVLLEEHTPKGLGNHACIITEFNEDLLEQTRALLEGMGYVGFSNFDIKYDQRDKKFKFFELNTRQGRSNYYVTGSGYNIVEYVVEDLIYGRKKELSFVQNEHLWMVVPRSVAFSYVKDKQTKEKMRDLIKKNKFVNPVFLKGDLAPGRLYRLLRTHFGHFKKYKKFYS